MTRTAQYLLAIYIESQRNGVPVSSGSLAERLETSPPSATEMLQRLDDRGLVAHEAYDGATLTADGRQRAIELHRSYVTLSWFFRSVLELENHEAEAMEMAGALTPGVVDRLTTVLPVDEQIAEPESRG